MKSWLGLILLLPFLLALTVMDEDGDPAVLNVVRLQFTASRLAPTAIQPAPNEIAVRRFDSPGITIPILGVGDGNDVAAAWGGSCFQVRVGVSVGGGLEIGTVIPCGTPLLAGLLYTVFIIVGSL